MNRFILLHSTEFIRILPGGGLLRGTHGTSRSRALSILEAGGFRPSTEGMAGPGVYFWAYDRNPFVATEFAKLWWRSASSKNAYAGDNDQSCAVLDASIERPAAEYVDLTELALREQMLELLYQHGCTRQDAPKVVGAFIDALERHANQRFTVVKTDVSAPQRVKGCTSPLTGVAGHATVYIVRHGCHRLIQEIRLLD